MSTVTILIDHRSPQGAKDLLSKEGRLLEVRSEGIVYPSISGHPDIFFCQAGEKLFHAPNTPGYLIEALEGTGAELIAGEEPLGNKYPGTARYNAVVTSQFIIHNFRYSDFSMNNHLPDLDPVHVSQGYTRCNLLALGSGAFISSDAGIYKSLSKMGLEVMMTDPRSIPLPGQRHGFFGGACGIWNDRVFIMGSLENYPGGDEIAAFFRAQGYHITELHHGPLVDTGSILFIES